MNTAIWQCDADRKTGIGAVTEFCATYFNFPRKAGRITEDGTFKLKDGRATYRLELIVDRDLSISVYRVTRLAPPEGSKA